MLSKAPLFWYENQIGVKGMVLSQGMEMADS
jgi:hypothetical protein